MELGIWDRRGRMGVLLSEHRSFRQMGSGGLGWKSSGR
jgi:hypothetical protein